MLGSERRENVPSPVIAALCALCLAAACKKKTEAATPAPAEPQTEHLTLVAAYEGRLLEDLLRAYLADKPEVQVKTVRVKPDEVLSRLRTGGDESGGDVLLGSPRAALESLARVGALAAHRPRPCDEVERQNRDEGGHWTGLTLSAIAIAANERLLEQKQLPLPYSWKDLARPRYRGWLVVARPQASRATRILLAGLVSLLYPKGWDMWRQIDRNLFHYAESAGQPGKLVANGEVVLALDLEHRLLAHKREGKRLKVYYPTPTFYELEGMALLKAARNLPQAKRFMQWLCEAPGMRVLERHRAGVARPFIEPAEPWKMRLTQIKLHTPERPLTGEEVLEEWKRRYGK
jgi:iron(III) transport system substrate-binding protein